MTLMPETSPPQRPERVCFEGDSPDMRHMTTGDRNIMIARVLRESEVVRDDRRGASRALQLERRSNERSPLRVLARRGLVEHQKLRS